MHVPTSSLNIPNRSCLSSFTALILRSWKYLRIWNLPRKANEEEDYIGYRLALSFERFLFYRVFYVRVHYYYYFFFFITN